jgi:hypothetical protein
VAAKIGEPVNGHQVLVLQFNKGRTRLFVPLNFRAGLQLAAQMMDAGFACGEYAAIVKGGTRVS